MKKRLAKKPLRKSVTLDDLANMMGSGFKEMRGEMQEDFKDVHARIDNFDERLSGRMDVLEQKINIVNMNVLELGEDYRKLRARVENLELKTFGSVQE